MTMMAIGGTVVDFLGASQKAKEDEARYQQNRINAAAARDLKISSLNTRMLQEQEAAAAQKEQLAIASLVKAETAKVAAGEAGFKGGSSIDNAIDQFETARLRTTTSINQQTKALRNQIQLEKMGASAEAQARIDSMPRGQEPSMFAAVATAGMQAYGGMKAAEANTVEAVAKRQLDVQDEVNSLLEQRKSVSVDSSMYKRLGNSNTLFIE
jgi:hypothetical protein